MISRKLQPYFNNFFWLFLTYLLSPVFYLMIFFRKRNKKERENVKILVIQTAKIGDLVCTTPVFREIKKNIPNCHLTVMILSQTKDVLRNSPRVDEIIVINDYSGIQGRLRLIRKLKRARYDWIFCIFPDSFSNILGLWSLIPERVATTYKHSGKITKLLSIFHNYRAEHKPHTSRIRHNLSLLNFAGIKEYSEEKEVFIKPEEEERALDFLRKNNLNSNDLLIGICLTAGVKLKEWEPAKYAALADELTEKLKAKVIFVGSAEDKKIVEKVQRMMQNSSVDASGYFKLCELASLLKNFKLFIAGDTGPLYIADALGIPLVDIPGPIDIYEQSPLHERCIIVKKDLYCAPCSFSPSFAYSCKEGHLRCLTEISPEDVFSAAASLLEKNK